MSVLPKDEEVIGKATHARYRTFLVHRHFLWFKAENGYRDSPMSHQYAVPQIGATKSDDEPNSIPNECSGAFSYTSFDSFCLL